MKNVEDLSYQVALDVIVTYKTLKIEFNEYSLFRQFLRSGTSVGANIQEALGSVSKRDFSHKFSISYKEARETKYWIRLLVDSGYLNQEQSDPLLKKLDELCRILYVSIRNARNQA